jgi:hypothetical protein
MFDFCISQRDDIVRYVLYAWYRHTLICKTFAPVAQLDRALPSEGKGHWFDSSRVRQLLFETKIMGWFV